MGANQWILEDIEGQNERPFFVFKNCEVAQSLGESDNF